MRILFAVSEALPYVKTGGLADVAGHLPRALAKRGHRIELFLPFYRAVRQSGIELQEITRVEVPLGDELRTAVIYRQPEAVSGVTAWFIGYEPFFDRAELYGPPGSEYPDNGLRFIFFCRALLETVKKLDLPIDIYHAHDWQTGLLPAYLKTLYKDLGGKSASLFTIHNLGYQGLQEKSLFPLTGLDWEEFTYEKLEFYDRLNLLKGGLVYADILNTVSPTYSREILKPEFGCGLDGVLRQRADRLYGILNGVDYEEWDPASDPLISHRYRPGRMTGKRRCREKLLEEFNLPADRNRPVVGMVSRLVEQKGIELILELLNEPDRFNCYFIFLGSGDSNYEKALAERVRRFPAEVAFRPGYDNRLAHQIEAGADLFLMPSRYEPCGLNQMYSLRYGTIPVVRAVGGLNDSIEDYDPESGRGNGFKFTPYTAPALARALEKALTLYREKPHRWWKLRRRAMACDFSWNRSAARYEELYRKAVAAAGQATEPK
jgi:starch synthase